MNCLEAQAKINNFIEDKLEPAEKLEFIRHVKCCDNCSEELEIYYTMIVGMKQLDEDCLPQKSYKQMLEDKLNSDYSQIKVNRRITRYTVIFLLMVLGGIGYLGYRSHLALVYQQEQALIKAMQSEYYYADSFSDYLFHEEDYEMFDFAAYMNQNKDNKDPKYYERLREYIATQEQKEGNNE